MSQRGTFDGLADLGNFDIITQYCTEVTREMNVDSSREKIRVAQTSALELRRPEFIDEDALFLNDDMDYDWLEDQFNEEVIEFEQMHIQLPEQPTSVAVASCDNVVTSVADVKVALAGFRELPHPELADAGRGKEKMKSEKNNNWSLRRADKLRSTLGWDTSIPFGDLPLRKVDELLSNLFSRVVNVKGGEYPAESLMNMLGGYNRFLRRASDLRSLKDPNSIPLGRDFDIKKHPAFTRTRLTLAAAIKKTAKDGTNKKRSKVNHITEAMEDAVLADVDHQIFHNEGCQKRTAFYLLVRCGIRGGDELWQLKRFDLAIKTDKKGREYVQYMERESKNNCYSLERNKEEQFRKPYHSYEADFILTVKQYLRHMPPWVEGNSDSLFLGCIKNPASIVWFNRSIKVGKGTSSNWLKNMLVLVGLPANLFSNKSGRATLITRLAAQGVPDHVGILLTGHHTIDGYGRYDRTKDLQQEAATLVASNPRLDYNTALANISKKFVEEDMVGTTENLKPLVYHVSEASSSNPIVPPSFEAKKQILCHVQSEVSSSGNSNQLQAGRILQNLHNQVPKPIQETVKLNDPTNKLALWNEHFDAIDWDAAMKSDPKLASLLGGLPRAAPIAIGAGNNFTNCQNCTIQINLPPTFNPSNFDWSRIADNKENKAP